MTDSTWAYETGHVSIIYEYLDEYARQNFTPKLRLVKRNVNELNIINSKLLVGLS